MFSGLRLFLFLLALGFLAGRASAQTPGACPECQLSLPPAAAVTASQVTLALPSSQGFARITLSGLGTSYSLTDGIYFGWCGDDSATIVRGSTQVVPYSTYSPSLPANIQSPEWPKVNWILNNKQGTFRDVQHAIWMVLRGSVDPTRLLSFPATPAALAMIAGAQTAGASFVPGPGQVTAIVLYQDGFGPTAGAQDTLVEVRVPECGVLGDFVWQDTNRNGLQDESGTGINGVTVRLRNASNVEIATTTTAQFAGQNGWYRFAGLCSGAYSVTADAPSGMVQTYAPGGSDPTADSNPQPAVATLNVTNEATRRDLTLDFGFNTPACEARLGDLVWLDMNQNGIQDIGEQGIANAEIQLSGPGGNRVTNTDSDGNYMFTGLCGGTYTVAVNPSTIPTGYTATPSSVGDDRDADSNVSPTTVTLANDTADVSLDFGYKPPCAGTIGDLVWMDTNLNGLQDNGEPGIHGVTVELRQNNTTIQTAVTVNGAYMFSGVCAGSYNVVVKEDTLPPGVVRTISPDLADPIRDSNPHPAPLVLLTNLSSDHSIDFGYKPAPCTARMGNFVWLDVNGNGSQDSGEPGIPNVRLELRDAAGAVVGTAQTDGGGFYSFSGLCGGAYKIRVYNPSSPVAPYPGLQVSPVNAGNPATDSNQNNDSVVLGYNTVDNTYDFGFKPGGYCTRTQGYWKNHVEKWPVSSLVIGDQTYTKSELLAIFRLSVGGDSSVNLAHQLIAAKLNLYAGAAVPSSVAAWIAQADAALSGFNKKLPYRVSNPSMVTIAGQLDTYNNGQIAGANHCDSNGTPGNGTPGNGGGNGGNEPCVPGSFSLTGNSSTDGQNGNIRTFADGTLKVKASAFSRSSGGQWSTAYLGAYSSGLGVTDNSEGDGGYDKHKLDNSGQVNYILFEFSSPVVVNKLLLDSIGADSDVSVWIGTKTDPFNNHLTLSDATLSSLGTVEENKTNSAADSRWADVNAAGRTGNVLVVAALASDTSGKDAFKVRKIDTTCPTTGTPGSCGGTIGNLVWKDVNKNGIQDNGDFGLSGVAVTLYASNGTTVLQTTTTESDGKYQFSGLCAGTYVVRAATPSGMEPTTARAGSNTSIDSNGSPTSVALTGSSDDDATVDFGFRWGTGVKPLDIKCDCLNGKVGSNYSFTVKAVGGTPKYTYKLVSGALPNGLSLNASTGVISGTPTKAGSFQFLVKVTDSTGKTDSTQCTIAIEPDGVALSCPLTSGRVGSSYSSRLTAANGRSPYTFSLLSGSLPKGLSLNSSSGSITGTPNMAGTWSFTGKVKDSTGDTATVGCSIRIEAPASGSSCIGKKDYWAENHANWPRKSVTIGALKYQSEDQSMVIGGKRYSKTEAIKLLETDDEENINVESAGQLATQLLNASAGGERTPLKDLILAAIDRLINGTDPLCFGDRCFDLPDSMRDLLRKYLDTLD